jgi:hypothetical protein
MSADGPVSQPAERERPEDPYQWLHDNSFSWDDVNAIAAILDHAGFAIVRLSADDERLRAAAEHVIDAWDHFESKYELVTSLEELRAALTPPATGEPSETP